MLGLADQGLDARGSTGGAIASIVKLAKAGDSQGSAVLTTRAEPQSGQRAGGRRRLDSAVRADRRLGAVQALAAGAGAGLESTAVWRGSDGGWGGEVRVLWLLQLGINKPSFSVARAQRPHASQPARPPATGLGAGPVQSRHVQRLVCRVLLYTQLAVGCGWLGSWIALQDPR